MLRPSETHRVFSPAMKLAVLRRHPVFGGLPLEHIQRLSAYASTRAYPRGATIFTKDGPGTGLFAVCSGTVRIAVPSPDGRYAVFGLIEEGRSLAKLRYLMGSRGRRTPPP